MIRDTAAVTALLVMIGQCAILPSSSDASPLDVVNRSQVTATADNPFRVFIADGIVTFSGEIAEKTTSGEDIIDVYFEFTFLDAAGKTLYVEDSGGWFKPGFVRTTIGAVQPGGRLDGNAITQVVLSIKALNTKQGLARARMQRERTRQDALRAEERRRRVAELELQAARETAEKERRAVILNKGWPPEIERAAIDRKLILGMTTEQAEYAAGRPERINETLRASGKSEHWVFRGLILYFENDRLTVIQRSR